MEFEKMMHEKMRKQVWLDAWCACASAFNCSQAEVATKWADKALAAFDERFKLQE